MYLSYILVYRNAKHKLFYFNIEYGMAANLTTLVEWYIYVFTN